MTKFQFLFVSTDSLHFGTMFRTQFGFSVKNITCAEIYFAFKQYISYGVVHIFIIIKSFNRYIIQFFPKHLIHLLCRKGNSSISNAYPQQKTKTKNKLQGTCNADRHVSIKRIFFVKNFNIIIFNITSHISLHFCKELQYYSLVSKI